MAQQRAPGYALAAWAGTGGNGIFFPFADGTHAGAANSAADALSRNNLPSFLLQIPQAQPTPNLIPQELAQLLLHQQPDWLSNTWRDNFKRFCQQGSPSQQPSPMLQDKGATCSSANR